MSTFDLPVSVVLALWAPLPSSRGIAVVEGADGAHEVNDTDDFSNSAGAASPWGLGRLPLHAWLTAFGPLSRVSAVLPSPADPLPGLAAAIDIGECVLLEATAGRRVLLIPETTGTSVVWRTEDLVTAPPPFNAGQARRDVHAATEEAIDALTELDLARERPELADELTDLVTAAVDPRVVPPSLDSRHRTLLERSLRLAAICELALADDGASATALQAERRTRVLRPLLTTARYGVAAATEWWGPRSSS